PGKQQPGIDRVQCGEEQVPRPPGDVEELVKRIEEEVEHLVIALVPEAVDDIREGTGLVFFLPTGEVVDETGTDRREIRDERDDQENGEGKPGGVHDPVGSVKRGCSMRPPSMMTSSPRARPTASSRMPPHAPSQALCTRPFCNTTSLPPGR